MKLHMMVCVAFACFSLAESHAASVLKGSFASQEKQNYEADKYELERIESSEHLENMKRDGSLVRIPEIRGVVVDPRLEEQFRWVRPWTAKFLESLGKEFYSRFRNSIQINSAARTVEYQMQLTFLNKNAAAPWGIRRSSHLTGATVDIGKMTLRPSELAWLRKRLKHFEGQDVVEATEEHQQLVFHVMVFKHYGLNQNRIALK